MCGRYSLGATAAALAQQFGLTSSSDWTPRYNIAPTQEVLAVLASLEGEGRTGRSLRWGLIPRWAKESGIGSRLINARAETAADKPAFREAFRLRRCLVPADAFFEWEVRDRRKQPWCIRMRDGYPFAFAGLWERWTDPGGGTVDTCAILTTAPNPLVGRFHSRMPVILAAGDYGRWLDPRSKNPEALRPLLAPFPSDRMTAYPVGSLVNNPAHDSPECLHPIG